MRLGIIGASKIEFLKKVNENCEEILTQIAKLIKEHEIVVTPDKGAVSEFVTKRYLEKGGKKVWEIIPLEDKEFGYEGWLNEGLGETINCGTWRNQPEKFNEETDALICCGYAVGVLAEIAYSKWFNPKPVYIINELVSGKLPIEVERSLNLNYISLKELKNFVK